MTQKAPTLVVTMAVIATSWVLLYSGGMHPETVGASSDIIGIYLFAGQENDLTEDHASWDGNKLVIETPPLTTWMKVDVAYIGSLFAAWATEMEFDPSDQA